MFVVISIATFLLHSLRYVAGSDCYPSYCHEKTLLDNSSDVTCFVEPAKTNDDCVNLSFENHGHFPPPGEKYAKVKLTAYVSDDNVHRKATAFNLSISHSNIQKLVTRYQNIGDQKLSECHQIEVTRNSTDKTELELFLSCSLAKENFETSPYRLEYLVSTDTFEYSRKLVFIVPKHKFIDSEIDDVKSYVPFIYIDVSDTSELSLFIQPAPEKFKVTSYRIWLINNGTKFTKNVTVASTDSKHIRYNFPVATGVYYFKVAPLHPSCDVYGCVNSTSPLISIKHASHRLLIMIISVIWIPPVIFYALFNAYKVYRKNEKLKRAERRPKCLLVYQPTHTLHVNVMLDLARYLRGCNIHAIIDVLDLSESENKDPAVWYNEMFHMADIVLWAASPGSVDGFVPSFTESVENQILALSKDYELRRSKKFYILQFPYCSINDLPEEAYSLKVFSLPDELGKLVKHINNLDFIRFFGVSNKLFIESVNAATLELVHERNKESNKNSESNEIPLLLEKTQETYSEGVDETSLRDETDGHFDQPKNTAEQLKLLRRLSSQTD